MKFMIEKLQRGTDILFRRIELYCTDMQLILSDTYDQRHVITLFIII